MRKSSRIGKNGDYRVFADSNLNAVEFTLLIARLRELSRYRLKPYQLGRLHVSFFTSFWPLLYYVERGHLLID